MGLRCRFAVLGLLPAAFPVAAGVAGVGVADAANGRPAIVSFAAAPKQVPASGARVVLSVRVRNATTCTFFAGSRTLKTATCASGRATATAPAVANTLYSAVTRTFAVRVRGAGGKTAQRSVTVTQAAAPRPPLTATLNISAPTVPGAGGTVTLSYSATNASSCTLAADPAFWSGANPASVDCNGSYDVTPGVATAQRHWTFTFTATNAAGQSATATQTLTQEAPIAPTASLTAGALFVSALGGTVTLTFSSTNAARCTLSASGLWSGAQTSGCNGTYDLAVPATRYGRTLPVTFSAVNSSGQYTTASASIVQFGGSQNWSGYARTSSGTVMDAEGTWTVPRLDCAATPDAGASEWVGIGGFGSGDLLQTGVRTDCVAGRQVNVGWWELYPDLPEIDFDAFTISAGDTVKAWVYQGTSGAWVTKLDDLTTGLTGVMQTGVGYGVMRTGASVFAVQGAANISYAGAGSAEWIVEAYSRADGSLIPFASFGTVAFSGLTMDVSPIVLDGEEGLELIGGGIVLAEPSLPTSGGFSVTYAG